jgi:hypothetical protein
LRRRRISIHRRNPPFPPGIWGITCLFCGTVWRWFEHYAVHAQSHHGIEPGEIEAASVEGSPGVGFYWRLYDGRILLMAQPMMIGGERVLASDQEGLREQDASGRIVTSQSVEGRQALCDFCQGRPIHAVWPAWRFLVDGRSMGSAALDRPCYQAVRNRNTATIVARMETVLRRQFKLIPRTVKDHLRALVEEWMANAETAGLPPIILPH